MAPLWKNRPFLGLGLGVGLIGAAALAIRQFRKPDREPIPDEISPAIFATRAAHTSKGQIVYHTSGSGAPLLFLHGIFLGASSYEWSKIYGRFAISHEVIAPDLIGFGESERPTAAMDPSDHVQSLAEFLQETAPRRPTTIIASGATAQIALLLAEKHPDLVARLVLFMPSALREPAQCQALGLIGRGPLPAINRFAYRHHIARPPFIRTWLTRSAFANPLNISNETVAVLSTCARQYGAERAIFGFLKNRRKFQTTSRPGDILAPVHILWPGAARAFNSGEATTLCRSLRQASLRILPEAAALAPIESPGPIGDAISEILDGGLRALSA
jgi:pimeloyl-ACP methyl ester carboxylesterase